MSRTAAVSVDLARGEVVLGALRVCLERVDQSHRFRIAGRAVVRTVTFEERRFAVHNARVGQNPARDLVANLRALAMDGESDIVADGVLLALAGGGEVAPAYEECAVTAAQALGWGWAAVNEAPAIEVDRVLAATSSHQEADGWTRFVFADGPSRDLEQTCSDMIERLLDRGSAVVEEPSSFSGTLSPSPSEPPDVERRQASPAESEARPAGLPVAANAGAPAAPERREAAQKARAGAFGRTLSPEPVQRSAPEDAPPPVPPQKRQAEIQAGAAATRARVRFGLPDSEAKAERNRISARVQQAGARRVSSPALSQQAASGPGSSHVPGNPEPFGFRPPAAPARAADWPPRGNPPSLAAPLHSWSLQDLQAGAGAAPALAVSNEQPDWLFEIAQALADECDIRGIDS
jgi:hypothetical protein